MDLEQILPLVLHIGVLGSQASPAAPDMALLLVLPLLRSLSLQGLTRLAQLLKWVDSDNVDPHFPEQQILLLYSLEQHLLVLLPPLLQFLSFLSLAVTFLPGSLLGGLLNLASLAALLNDLLFLFVMLGGLQLVSVVYLNTLVYDFTKLLDLLYSLLISFLHFLDYLEGSMLLTEHSVGLITILPLDFHAVIISTGAFHVEANDAS